MFLCWAVLVGLLRGGLDTREAEGMRTPSPRVDEPGHSPRFPAGSSDVKIHKASRKHTASFLASQQFLQKKSSLKALGQVFKTKV